MTAPTPPPMPTPSPIASPNPTTATTAKNRPSRIETPMRPGTFGNAAFHAEPMSVRRPIRAPRSTVNRIPVRIAPRTRPRISTIPDALNDRAR